MSRNAISLTILIILVTSIGFTGCLSYGESKDVRIEYVGHTTMWKYDSADQMQVIVRNNCDHPVYNFHLECIEYYINDTNFTKYLLSAGEGINKKYSRASLLSEEQESFIVLIKFHQSEYYYVPENNNLLENNTAKIVFKLSWEYEEKAHHRIQTFEYKFEE